MIQGVQLHPLLLAGQPDGEGHVADVADHQHSTLPQVHTPPDQAVTAEARIPYNPGLQWLSIACHEYCCSACPVLKVCNVMYAYQVDIGRLV
jgi:hypothetical protein